MSNEVIVHKGRTNTLRINMGIDVSDDVITSQIRTEPTVESPLICEWEVDFVTDGSDGELILTLDDIDTVEIAVNAGYMDLKRVVAGEPRAVFDRPLEVVFRGTVTE